MVESVKQYKQFLILNSRGLFTSDRPHSCHCQLSVHHCCRNILFRWFMNINSIFFLLTAKINETDTFGPGDDDEIQFDDIGDDDEDIDDVSIFHSSVTGVVSGRVYDLNLWIFKCSCTFFLLLY